MNSFLFTKNINHQLLGQKIVLHGWITKITKLGKIFFLVLRDGFGTCQLIVHNKYTTAFNVATKLNKESVVQIIGFVQKKHTDKNVQDVQFEISVDKINVINHSKLSPFLISDQTDGLEKLRLKYRYLDLRRPKMQKIFWTRQQIYQEIRHFFVNKQNFVEIETPILASPTVEGARNFLIESNVKKKHYFALPQSPQIYKQLLMAGGFPGYFQIARCFRDEDLRNDRQPEFSQLDFEVNFADQFSVMNYIEELILLIWKKFSSQNTNSHFIQIDYQESWNKFGTDSPDLRYDLFLEDYSFLNHSLEIKNTSQKIKGIRLPKCLDSNLWNKIKQEIQKFTSLPLLFWFSQSKLKTNLNSLQQKKLLQFNKNNLSFNWVGFASNLKETNLVLGKVRILLAEALKLTVNKSIQFCWIVKQPMFQFSENENKYVSTHHPFCQPLDVVAFKHNWKTSIANAYDLVCNGIELGSGSVRIHDLSLQKKVFTILGMTEETMMKEFGFFLTAMEYGYPNHAGFALGLDRLLMILTETKSIRDVIAFPKTSKSTCLLTETPKKKV